MRGDFVGKQRRHFIIPQDHDRTRGVFSRDNGVRDDQMIPVRHVAEQLHTRRTAIEDFNEIRQFISLL